MAKKGTVVWELVKTRQDTRRHYAYNSDGKLLTKYVTLDRNGRVQYDFGWKLAKGVHLSNDDLKQYLLEQGYAAA